MCNYKLKHVLRAEIIINVSPPNVTFPFLFLKINLPFLKAIICGCFLLPGSVLELIPDRGLVAFGLPMRLRILREGGDWPLAGCSPPDVAEAPRQGEKTIGKMGKGWV